MDHLAAAARALGDHSDRAAALEHLVRAWRAHDRHPKLAALVEALSAEITRGLAPLDLALGDPDFHAAWIARATNAGLVDVEILVPGMFRGPLGKRIRERFDLLVPFADDPRVTAAFGRMIDEPPVMAASNFPLWTQLFAALHRAPDVRLRSTLERAVTTPSSGSQFWPMLQQRCLTLLRALPEHAEPLGPELDEQLAAVRRRITELAAAPAAPVVERSDASGVEAELLARIYAEPDVLEHRMVWADALLSRGDPRGEFVQLQLAREGDEPPSKRERELLGEHELTWLGPLAAVIERKQLRWANGFPVAAEVVIGSQTGRELIGDPAWATFRELDCGDPELLGAPIMRSLGRAGGLGAAALRTLVELEAPAAATTELGPIILEHNPPAEVDAIRNAPAARFADVRAVWLHLHDHDLPRRPADFDWLFESALGRRLTGFRLSTTPYARDAREVLPWPAWIAARDRWPRLERLRLDAPPHSIELRERGARLIVRTWLLDNVSGTPMDRVRELLEHFRGVVERLELISCGERPVSEATARRWAEFVGLDDWAHAHAPGDQRSAFETMRALRKMQARQRRASSQLARVGNAKTRPKPKPPRRYGPGPTGPWLAREDALVPDGVRFRWISQIGFAPAGDELFVVGLQLGAFAVPELEPRWGLRELNLAHLHGFALDPSTERLWLGTQTGGTILWDLREQRELARARFHRNRISALAIAGERMYSVDLDRKLHAWRLPLEPSPEQPIMLVPEHGVGVEGPPWAMALDPAGVSLAVIIGARLRLYDADDLARRRELGVIGHNTTGLAWSPEGDHLAAADREGHLAIWDPDGAPLMALKLFEQRLADFAWTPDGAWLAVSGEDRSGARVRVVDCETGEIVRVLEPPGRVGLSRVAVSPDGRWLALSAHGQVACWSLADGALRGVWPRESGRED